MYQQLINKLNLMFAACQTDLANIMTVDRSKFNLNEMRRLVTLTDEISGKLEVIEELLRWARAKVEESVNV